MRIKIFFAVFLLSGGISSLSAQRLSQHWVDSVFQTLSLDEKIGQILMVPVNSHQENSISEIKNEIKSHHLGGIIFVGGGPEGVAKATQAFQKVSSVPLLIGIDGERGLGQVLDSSLLFPSPLTLGAVPDTSLIRELGEHIGRQMKLLGIHFNFAPSANLIFFPGDSTKNGFGSDPVQVGDRALAYLKGLTNSGVLACAKNFPFKGLTVTKVEKGIPVLSPYVDSLSIKPYLTLFRHGLMGVLPGSDDFPLFYQKKKTARKNNYSSETLSAVFVGDWIKKQLNFTGLTFSQVGLLKEFSGKSIEGEASLMAFQAGNDVLLYPDDIGGVIRKIKRLLKKQKGLEEQLNQSVKKILWAKYQAGLSSPVPVETENISIKLNQPQGEVLKGRLLGKAITIVKNDGDLLPIKNLEGKSFAVLCVGMDTATAFTETLKKYVAPALFSIRIPEDTVGLNRMLEKYEVLIVGISPFASQKSDLWLSQLQRLETSHQLIICNFRSPFYLRGLESFSKIIQAYSDEKEVMRLVPQIIFGGRDGGGKLPVQVKGFTLGEGLEIKNNRRLGFGIPEEVGMDSRILKKIEAIAYEGIQMGATPGCHVLVAKEGKVVFEKSFGWYTYDRKQPVNAQTLYDLASVTKVSATLQAFMFLYDRGLVDVYKKASLYLPELKESNKKNFSLKDILTHQAGLWPYLPFWINTMQDSTFLPGYYSHEESEDFPFFVSDRLYAAKFMKDSLWHWIINAKIREKPVRTPFDYRYSDMGFYILQHLAEKLLNQPMEEFLYQNLYEPLGAYTTGYLPLDRFPKNRIAPTEHDKGFRKSLLIGAVHDQGAALQGGVAGHAGLFSDAIDLAKLYQMLLQEGYYGGIQYYKPETVKYFIEKQYETSRRGLGWDKPVLSDWKTPTSIYASPKTFGHTGFTGTCVWVDPVFNLVYVFLSNRVHPDMNNNKLLNANIRSRIQDVIYEAIFNFAQYGEGPCK